MRSADIHTKVPITQAIHAIDLFCSSRKVDLIYIYIIVLPIWSNVCIYIYISHMIELAKSLIHYQINKSESLVHLCLDYISLLQASKASCVSYNSQRWLINIILWSGKRLGPTDCLFLWSSQDPLHAACLTKLEHSPQILIWLHLQFLVHVWYEIALHNMTCLPFGFPIFTSALICVIKISWRWDSHYLETSDYHISFQNL